MSFFFDQKFLPKIWLIIVVLGVVFFHFFPFVQPWSMPVFLQSPPKDGFVQSISLITPVLEKKATIKTTVVAPVQSKTPTKPNLAPRPLNSAINQTLVTTAPDNNSPAQAEPQLVPESSNSNLSTADLVKEQLIYEQELKKIREEKLAVMAQSVASEAQISSANIIANFEGVKVPSPRTLLYKVQAVNMIAPGGSATLKWEQENGVYQLNFEATAAILYTIRWASQGVLLDLGLAPSHFTEKRFRSSETAAHFDYENQLISFSKKEAKTPMLPGAQDRFSVVIQLASIIAADPERFKAGQNIVIQVANSELAEAWVFNVLATEPLTWSGKSYETLRLQRQARKPYDAQLELWLAKDLEYMPVRIKQTPVTGAGFDAIWMGP